MFSSLTRSSAPRLSRALSSAASHRPPIDIYGIHGRYANATYTAASKNDTLSLVETELTALKSSIESSPDRRQYLENPLVDCACVLED